MARHLSDEDLDSLELWLEERILKQIRALKEEIMSDLNAVTSDLAAVTAELATLETGLTTLLAAHAAGVLTPEQQAQLDAADAQIVDLKTKVAALSTQVDAANATATAVPAPVPAPVVAFVAKVADETYPDYVARANAAGVGAIDEASWNSLPVG